MEDWIKLKPCPFCGGEAHMWRDDHRVHIQCERWNAVSHLIQVSGLDEQSAVDAWNERITPFEWRRD